MESQFYTLAQVGNQVLVHDERRENNVKEPAIKQTTLNPLLERVKGMTLTDIVKLISEDPALEKLANEDPSVFQWLKQEHHLTQIKSFQDLLTLQEQLGKVVYREKTYKRATVPDVQVGDRVVLNYKTML